MSLGSTGQTSDSAQIPSSADGSTPQKESGASWSVDGARDTNLLPERALMKRVAAGNHEAFTTLYERQAGVLFSTVYQILNDQEEAEDVLQETFLEMRLKAAAYDAARGSIFTWSIMLSRRRAIAKLRSRPDYKQQTETSRIAKILKLGEGNGNNDGQLSRKRVKGFQSAPRKTDNSQREALLLAVFGGLNLAQISARLEIPLNEVRAHIRTGLLALHK